MLQYRQPQPNQSAATVAAFDDHPGSVSVEHLQTLGDVRHPDSHTAQTIGLVFLA
jgi:hypothetical protein